MSVCRLQGEHPHRIWDLIYSQSCFQDALEQCTERRVFYRLISGAAGRLHLCTVWAGHSRCCHALQKPW